MNLSTTQKLLAIAETTAQEQGFSISISVVDLAGLQVGFARMDGAALGTIDVAIKKARTAALFHTDSLQLGLLARAGEALYSIENTNGGLISFGGGVTIENEQGRIIGALGIAGATLEADEIIAQHVKAVM